MNRKQQGFPSPYTGLQNLSERKREGAEKGRKKDREKQREKERQRKRFGEGREDRIMDKLRSKCHWSIQGKQLDR